MILKLRIAIFCILIMLGDCWARSLEQDLAQNETGRTASELVSLCRSSTADRLTYCQGYIEGATHFWQYQNACASAAQSDQSFCAGAEAAREAIRKFFEACADCDINGLEPGPTHAQRFMERMRKLPGELKTALGICAADRDYNKHYCSGYNKEAEISIAELSAMYSSTRSEDARLLGLGHGKGDVGLHLFASKEFYELRPCVKTAVDAKKIRNILLAFVRENPEQEVNTTAVLILGKALSYVLCTGSALQRERPHTEQCITWVRDHEHAGARNICDTPVVIEFISQHALEAELGAESEIIPGNSFSANPGLSRMPWVFTACPVGSVSSVALRKGSIETIKAGKYGCISK